MAVGPSTGSTRGGGGQSLTPSSRNSALSFIDLPYYSTATDGLLYKGLVVRGWLEVSQTQDRRNMLATEGQPVGMTRQTHSRRDKDTLLSYFVKRERIDLCQLPREQWAGTNLDNPKMMSSFPLTVSLVHFVP